MTSKTTLKLPVSSTLIYTPSMRAEYSSKRKTAVYGVFLYFNF